MQRATPLLIALAFLLGACSGRVLYNRGTSAIRNGDPSKLQRFVERHGDKQPYADMAEDHLAWFRAARTRDPLGLPVIDGLEQYIAVYPNGLYINEARMARSVVKIVHDESPTRSRIAMLKALYIEDVDNPFIARTLARFLNRIAFTTETMALEYSDLESSSSPLGALFGGKIQGTYADYAGAVAKDDVVVICSTDRISSIDVPNQLNRTLGELFMMTLHDFDEASLESLVRGDKEFECSVGTHGRGETWGWIRDPSTLSMVMPDYLAGFSIPSSVRVRRVVTVGGGTEVVERNEHASPRPYEGTPGGGMGNRYSSLTGPAANGSGAAMATSTAPTGGESTSEP